VLRRPPFALSSTLARPKMLTIPVCLPTPYRLPPSFLAHWSLITIHCLPPDDDSPYPEVRASVSNTDDPTMPVSTIRAWTLGILWAILLPGVNEFFHFRYPALYITPVSVFSCFPRFLCFSFCGAMNCCRCYSWSTAIMPNICAACRISDI
jgi:hypothetical protein